MNSRGKPTQQQPTGSVILVVMPLDTLQCLHRISTQKSQGMDLKNVKTNRNMKRSQMKLSITPKDNFRPQISQATLQCNYEKRSQNSPKGMTENIFFSFSFLFHGKNNEKPFQN
jgi:hypothetical protein